MIEQPPQDAAPPNLDFLKRQPDLQSLLKCSIDEIVEREPINVGSAWTAGFIDGEGHIYISRTKPHGSPFFYGRIRVTNTDYYPLACLKHTYGGSISVTNARRPKEHKKCYRWELSGSAAYELLRTIERYFVVKAPQSKLFRQFWQYRDQKDPNLLTLARYRQRMAALNRRGPKQTPTVVA